MPLGKQNTYRRLTQRGDHGERNLQVVPSKAAAGGTPAHPARDTHRRDPSKHTFSDAPCGAKRRGRGRGGELRIEDGKRKCKRLHGRKGRLEVNIEARIRHLPHLEDKVLLVPFMNQLNIFDRSKCCAPIIFQRVRPKLLRPNWRLVDKQGESGAVVLEPARHERNLSPSVRFCRVDRRN
eukprot:scaffold282895_cov28-Tisochrysis_lutea.AAC.10